MRRSQGERVAVLEAEVTRLRDQQVEIMAAIVQLQESFQACARSIVEVNERKLDTTASAAMVSAVTGLMGTLRGLADHNTAVMLVPRHHIRGG